MENRTHRGQRSRESREFRKTRSYCYHNSKYDPRLQEQVFVGTPAEVKAFVLVEVQGAYAADIPDAPQGLVLADNHCTGAFQ